MNTRFVSFVAFVSLMASSVPARAELAYFATGRTLSIKSHRVEGDSLVLTLRGGGEISCSPGAIARFAPDEVPYPEPEAVAEAPAAALPGVAAGRITD